MMKPVTCTRERIQKAEELARTGLRWLNDLGHSGRKAADQEHQLERNADPQEEDNILKSAELCRLALGAD